MDSALKKHDNYYPQVFLKECEYIEKKVIRHIIDVVESYSDDSDEFNEEKIQSMKLMFLKKFLECIFWRAILKKHSGC